MLHIFRGNEDSFLASEKELQTLSCTVPILVSEKVTHVKQNYEELEAGIYPQEGDLQSVGFLGPPHRALYIAVRN